VANIKDIAALAQVSVATVSRALSKPEIVRGPTYERVRQAIEQLDYHRNARARSLRRRRSETVVVAVPEIHNTFFSGVVQGIENVAHAHGYKILLGETQRDQARLDTYAAMVCSMEADGLILLEARLPSPRRAHRKGPAPIVFACEYFDVPCYPTVRVNNVAAAKQAVAHLLGLGHRVIATITGPLNSPLGRDRLKGYELALEEAGIKPLKRYIIEGDFLLDQGHRAADKLVRGAKRPTAIFCANDEMAMGAMKASHEAGLVIPRDISIIGFDDIRFAAYAYPPLTTIVQPVLEIGEAAMNLMIGRLENDAREGEMVLPARLVERGSTGPVPNHSSR
jgi:LacI family repressor for deo operon, udp, cdd, tsx, nupC, and nupG